jgi:hypothetical protein
VNRLRAWWRRRHPRPFDWLIDAPEYALPKDCHVRRVAAYPPEILEREPTMAPDGR